MNTCIIYRLLSKVLLVLAGAFGLCLGVGALNGELMSGPLHAGLLDVHRDLAGTLGNFPLARTHGSLRMFRREALCLIGLSWLLATLIGAIPYLLIVENCDFADAIFESSSGLTTTGATAFNHFNEFPASLLFWRSLSQWMGGLGVVVFFVALLSFTGSGRENPVQ